METDGQTAILIDYLSISKPGLELSGTNEVAAYLYDYDGCEKWDDFPVPTGYKYAIRNEIGAIGASGRKGQGTLFTWSGSALKKANALTIGETALLNDWRITRIDLTIDFVGFWTTVTDYREEFDNGQVLTKAKRYREIKSDNGGHTLYLGAWTSERFMRIYNKTASEARFLDSKTIPQNWLRVELVLRDNHAKSGFSYIVHSGLRVAIPALLRGYADFVNIEEYVGSADKPAYTSGIVRKDNDKQRWLLEQVYPTLVRELQKDKEFQNKFMGLLVKALGIS